MPIKPYDRIKAVEYAHKWSYSRNPKYYNFDALGGDCTNFISQAIYAGSGVMNYTPTFGWYYINLNKRAPAWTGVPYLYNFIISNTAAGPFGEEISVENIEIGDFIQLRFAGDTFQHSLIVVKTGLVPSINNIEIATHTYDSDYRLLSSYSWSEIRFIHIKGVRY